jgi:hypothetical protein
MCSGGRDSSVGIATTLRAGRFGGSNPGGCEIFPFHIKIHYKYIEIFKCIRYHAVYNFFYVKICKRRDVGLQLEPKRLAENKFIDLVLCMCVGVGLWVGGWMCVCDLIRILVFFSTNRESRLKIPFVFF